MQRYSRDIIKQRAANARRNTNDSIENTTTSFDAPQDNAAIATLGAVNGHSGQWVSPSAPGHHEGGGQDASPNSVATSDQPSYREISWSNMFSHFLDSRHSSSRDAIDKCSITYLGESFPLSIVLDDLQEGGRLRLHHPGPPLDDNASTPGGVPNKDHPSHLLPEDMNCLFAKKAFDRPEKSTYDALMSCMMETYWPLYPIFNRQEFLEQYTSNTLPWLLLQASWICWQASGEILLLSEGKGALRHRLREQQDSHSSEYDASQSLGRIAKYALEFLHMGEHCCHARGDHGNA
jgi:hypothetical protein